MKSKNFISNKLIMKGIIKLSLISLCVYSCNQSNVIKELYISSIEIEKDVLDSIEIDLSDISKDLHIVNFETYGSVFLDGGSPIIGENFIVMRARNDYYLFDRNGKYLKRLLKIGKGPDEFIDPTISMAIRNDVIYISDGRKSSHYVYAIDLLSGKLSSIPKTNGEIINVLIPDTDSTLLMISHSRTSQTYQNTSYIADYSLIRQNFAGKLLSKISLGSHKSYRVIPPHDYQMFKNHEEILISSPRCDSIMSISNERLFTLWRNFYKTNFNEQLSTQKVPYVEIIHYSKDTILLSKLHRVYQRNMYSGGRDQICLIDRVNNKIFAVKKIYFKDKKMLLNNKEIHLFPDNLFAIVLKPEEISQMLNEPLLKLSILKIMTPESQENIKTISPFDNPFILIGRFK